MGAMRLRSMAVAAHPLDPAARAGGTVAQHMERGYEAMLVSLTAGAVTHAFGFFPPIGEVKLKDMERVKAVKWPELERSSSCVSTQNGDGACLRPARNRTRKHSHRLCHGLPYLMIRTRT